MYMYLTYGTVPLRMGRSQGRLEYVYLRVLPQVLPQWMVIELQIYLGN